MNPVEKVARVLCARCGVDPDDTNDGTWDGGSYPRGEPAWKTWADDARAAIAAMPGWQSVKTVPLEKSVLVSGKTLTGETYVAVGIRLPPILGFGQWDLEFGLGVNNLSSKPAPPTHWQPMPEPPEVPA